MTYCARDAATLKYDVGIRNTSLFSGVVLWNVKTDKPVYKFAGNGGKTYATISPDGKYVVSGDENMTSLVWSTKNGKQLLNIPVMRGYLKTRKSGKLYFDDKGFPKMPTDFKDEFGQPGYLVLSIKFIDKDYYLRFPNGVPYAVLYHVTNPIPRKYLPLSKKTMDRH